MTWLRERSRRRRKVCDAVIRAAEEVAGILESRGVGVVVIGAVALAAFRKRCRGWCWR